MASKPDRSAAGRLVFVGHSGLLSGAELQLLDVAPAFAGALVLIFEDGPLVAELRARGVDVAVLGDADATISTRRSSGILGALRALPSVFRIARALVRRTRRRDVLYANTQKAWVVVALAAKITGRKAIWHLHDIVSAGHFSPIMAKVGSFLANHVASAVIVNSKATGESFVAQGGRPELLRVVYNGVDTTRFNTISSLERNALRSEQGVCADEILVGLFGRITPWKGQHVLLEALKPLVKVRAVLVGSALFGEEDYQCQLEREALTTQLKGRIRFLGFRRDIPALMQAVDVVVHTSTSPEPFGRVVVEAMLSRRPVIAARGGGVNEIIADGIEGLLVPPGDAVALTAAIQTLISDSELASRIALAGFGKALASYSLDHMIQRLTLVLHEVCAPRVQ